MGCAPTFVSVLWFLYLSATYAEQMLQKKKRKGKQSPTLLAARNSKAATDFTTQMFWKLLLLFFSIVFVLVSHSDLMVSQILRQETGESW